VASVVDLGTVGGALEAALGGIRDLTGHVPAQQWLLVGGLMVLTHAAEHGVEELARPTSDGDLVVDLRLVPDGGDRVTTALREIGFEFVGQGPDGEAHRFERGNAVIDVLAPDHIGERANVEIDGLGRLVQAPGATLALQHAALVALIHDAGPATVIARPDLAGALLAKAKAMTLPQPERHERDVAMLLIAAGRTDARPVVEKVRETRGRRRAIATAAPLLDRTHRAWSWYDGGDADLGRVVLRSVLPERTDAGRPRI
jgi:hypothetical protein